VRRSASDLLGALCLAAAVLLTVPSVVSADDGTTTSSSTPATSVPVVTDAGPDTTSPATSDAPASSDTAAASETTAPATSDTASPATNDTTTSAPGPLDSGTQSVVISDVAVAIADSGGNTSLGVPLPASANQAIATGAASAIGSIDQTSLTQSAAITLADQATANLVQIAIVFNVGIAGANTGANTASSAGGTAGAGVTTGNATAVGNDAANYVTQGATAAAPITGTDTASQLTVTLHLGVAVANTGGNAASGGAAAATTGSATAVGNQSLTNVAQTATLAGSGTAAVSVRQQVLVLNLGVALANTGAGDVSQLAVALLQTPTQDLAAQLFALLLPALAAASGAPTGAGAASTGNASAIGNQSVTQIAQTASASAGGTGSASVDQQVVVANVGAAIANTGLNGAAASVDMAGVQQLASFFAQLLQGLQAAATATGPTAQHFSFSVPLGALMVALQADFTGTVSSPVAGATVHQLAAVISIGVSVANSGGNTSTNPSTTNPSTTDPSTTGTTGTTGTGVGNGAIVTGNATAHNTSIVVVCQLDNSTATCLVPPAPAVTPAPAPTTTTTVTVNAAAALPPSVLAASGQLPSTGGGLDPLVPASVLFVTGFVLFAVGRRHAVR
jgi:hypothetical protein